MYGNDRIIEFTPSFAYEIKGDSAVVLRCFSRDGRVEIPEQIEGYPVTEIGAYAFSAHLDEAAFQRGIKQGRIRFSHLGDEQIQGRTDDAKNDKAMQMRSEDTEYARLRQSVLAGSMLKEAVLPSCIERIGKYCFYNCANLEKITFGGALQDWGAGAFTGVHHVHELTVTADTQGKTSLKQVLDELHEEISVTYFDDNGREARLVFPEYFEEGVENTPARILEEKIHGSGMMYRNCIKERKLDFRQYDALFEHAGFLESGKMTMRLALGRLRYPVGLSEHAREQYEAYVRADPETAAHYFLETRDLAGVEWLVHLIGNGSEEERKKKQQLQSYLIQKAAEEQFTEAIGFLMDLEHKDKKPKRRRFEL